LYETIGWLLVASDQYWHCIVKARWYNFHWLHGKGHFYWHGELLYHNKLKVLLRDGKSSEDSKAIKLILKPSTLSIKICHRLKCQRSYSRNSIIVQINGSILEKHSSHWSTIMSRYPMWRKCIISRAVSKTRRPRSSISLNSLMQKTDPRWRIHYMKKLYEAKPLIKPAAESLDTITNIFNILKHLYDKIELEVLCDYIFVYTLARKLDKETLKEWNESRLSNFKIPIFKNLTQFLLNRLIQENRVARKAQSSGSKPAINTKDRRNPNDLEDGMKTQSMLKAPTRILCAHYVEEN